MPVKVRPQLGEQNEHRIHNMKLCCDLINGTLLKPKNVFSLQHCIGEPGEKRGFKTGPVIINGTLGHGSGGGICQISTVLFNTALLGNLRIIEKHNHSSDIWGENRMIGLGRDAAYVYLRKDLIFQNNSRYPLQVSLELDRTTMTLTGSLYRPEMYNDEKVKISTDVLEDNTSHLWVVKTKRTATGTDGKSRTTYRKTEKYRKCNE
ncbi:MAG: VanW family protein [Chitinispirillaceae bacterium]